MENFVFNKSRENMVEFNARLSEFCDENAVINAVPQSLGKNLILFLTLADDHDVSGVPTITLMVRPLDSRDADLEEQLTNRLIEASDREEEQLISALVIPQAADPSCGWLVLTLVNGEAEETAPGTGEEGDVKEPEVLPPVGGGFPAGEG